LGLLLVGCQVTDSQNSRIAAQSGNSVCAGYGIRIGAATFNDCVAYQDSRNPGPSHQLAAESARQRSRFGPSS